MYKLTKTKTILRLEDNASIPPDENNKDYREYLAWIEEGNEPEPADLPIPKTDDELKKEAYAEQGITPDAMIEALWEKDQGDTTKADKIQAKIESIDIIEIYAKQI